MANSHVVVRLANTTVSDFLKAVSDDLSLNNLHGRIRKQYDQLRSLDQCCQLDILDEENKRKIWSKWGDGTMELDKLLVEFNRVKDIFMKCLNTLELPNDFTCSETDETIGEILLNAKILNERPISDHFNRNFDNVGQQHIKNSPDQPCVTAGKLHYETQPLSLDRSTQTESDGGYAKSHDGHKDIVTHNQTDRQSSDQEPEISGLNSNQQQDLKIGDTEQNIADSYDETNCNVTMSSSQQNDNLKEQSTNRDVTGSNFEKCYTPETTADQDNYDVTTDDKDPEKDDNLNVQDKRVQATRAEQPLNREGGRHNSQSVTDEPSDAHIISGDVPDGHGMAWDPVNSVRICETPNSQSKSVTSDASNNNSKPAIVTDSDTAEGRGSSKASDSFHASNSPNLTKSVSENGKWVEGRDTGASTSNDSYPAYNGACQSKKRGIASSIFQEHCKLSTKYSKPTITNDLYAGLPRANSFAKSRYPCAYPDNGNRQRVCFRIPRSSAQIPPACGMMRSFGAAIFTPSDMKSSWPFRRKNY